MSNGSYAGSSKYSFHIEKLLENGTIFRERSDLQAKTLSHIQKDDDNKSILQLERELNNCCQEIDYLQDQLNEKNSKVQSLQEHVCSLKEEVTKLREELMMSVTERSYLLQELENNFVELYNGKQLIEKLEKSISCSDLEFQCEIEGMKLNMLETDQKYLEAIKENARMKVLIQELEAQIQKEEEEDDECLRKKNRRAKNTDAFKPVIGEQFRRRLVDDEEKMSSVSGEGSSKFRGDPGANSSELIELQTSNTMLKEKVSKMSNEIHEWQLLVEQLKAELKEERLKAKEEAEDLAQEMAELKYQLTSLLEAEYQRRARVEGKSLQRISELEDELEKERRKSFNHHEQVKSATALRRIEAS